MGAWPKQFLKDFFTKVVLSHLANEKDWAIPHLVCRLWIREGRKGVPTPSFCIADHALPSTYLLSPTFCRSNDAICPAHGIKHVSLGGRDASAITLPKDGHPSIMYTCLSAVHIHFRPFILTFLMGWWVESRDPRLLSWKRNYSVFFPSSLLYLRVNTEDFRV